MKNIFATLIICLASMIHLSAKTNPITASVRLEEDGKLTYSPRVQVVDGKSINLRIGQDIKHKNEELFVGAMLELTVNIVDGMAKFNGIATASHLTGKTSNKAMYVTAITSKEFHFSGECAVGEDATIDIGGKDGIEYTITVLIYYKESPNDKRPLSNQSE